MEETDFFSKRLKEFRKSLGMTQKEFAEKLGITPSAFSAYENNSVSPSSAIISKLALIFGVSVDWLYGLSDKPYRDDRNNNYGDVIKMLIKLRESMPYELKHEAIDPSDDESPLSIHIGDSLIQSFLHDWTKIYELYLSDIIDTKLYDLWIADQIKEFSNVPLDDIEKAKEALQLREMLKI